MWSQLFKEYMFKEYMFKEYMSIRGVAGGGGDITLCQSKGTHQIVMLFWPPVVGCLFKKGLHGHP